MPSDQKKKAYRCDVTYVTNSAPAMTDAAEHQVTCEVSASLESGELGFDYLRDQMAPSPSDLSLREGTP